MVTSSCFGLLRLAFYSESEDSGVGSSDSLTCSLFTIFDGSCAVDRLTDAETLSNKFYLSGISSRNEDSIYESSTKSSWT